MSHSRVVNVMAPGATWDVYVGRGNCPRRGPAGRTRFGNPWPVARYGHDAMRRYLDYVERLMRPEDGIPAFREAVAGLRGKVLGCWCVGRFPVCHGEVLARLADGEDLAAIRLDVLSRLDPQGELFDAGRAPARTHEEG